MGWLQSRASIQFCLVSIASYGPQEGPAENGETYWIDSSEKKLLSMNNVQFHIDKILQIVPSLSSKLDLINENLLWKSLSLFDFPKWLFQLITLLLKILLLLQKLKIVLSVEPYTSNFSAFRISNYTLYITDLPMPIVDILFSYSVIYSDECLHLAYYYSHEILVEASCVTWSSCSLSWRSLLAAILSSWPMVPSHGSIIHCDLTQRWITR